MHLHICIVVERIRKKKESIEIKRKGERFNKYIVYVVR